MRSVVNILNFIRQMAAAMRSFAVVTAGACYAYVR